MMDDGDARSLVSKCGSSGELTSSPSSSVFGSEDSRSNIISSSSGSSSGSGSVSNSGEIPAAVVVAAAASVVPSGGGAEEEKVVTAVVATTVVKREGCVGRRNKDVMSWGFTSVIGRRREMEDAVAVIPGFMSRTCSHVGGCTAPASRTSVIVDEISPVNFFGVYDGHGGSQVAKFCAERMHEVVAEEWERGGADRDGWRQKWEEAFSVGFERADNEIVDLSIASEIVGSTAVMVAVSACQIIACNCGDSRAVLCRGTQTIPLTVDHKPDREDELARIEGEGGKVINWNGSRVFGVLAMSRAIGDRFMRPWIIPVPDVTFTTRAEEDECLIVASDGLWDVMSNDDVGGVARHLLKRLRRSAMKDGTSPCPAQAVADHLTDLAYRRNSTDNISVIVVDLKPRRKRVQKTVKEQCAEAGDGTVRS